MVRARTLQTFKRADVPTELLVGADFKKLFGYAIADWLIYILCGYGLFISPPYLYPVFVIIMAGRLHAFGVLIHDLCHTNYKPKTISIRIFEVLVGYPIGTTINAMAYHHLRHHRNTLLDNDPYFNLNKKCSGLGRMWLTFKKGLFFVPFWIVRSFVGVFASFMPSLRTPYARIFLQDVSGQDLSHDEEVIECAKADIPLAIFHICLLFLTTKFEFLLYTYYYVIPVGGVFCIYRLLIEHEYEIVEDRSVYTMIESTFDHHTNIFARITVGPRNIGFHCMHHIHPSVGLHQLPKLRDWYYKNSEHYQLRYSTKPQWSLKKDLFGGINDAYNNKR